MDYKVNHLSTVEKELQVTWGSEEVSKNFKDSFKRLAKTANVKGFRPGKVPVNVVRQLYGKSIKSDIEEYLINAGMQDAIVKEQLRVIRAPEIDDKSELKDGNEFSFSFKVEIFPEVTIEPKEYELEYSPVLYKDDMLEEEIKAIKKRYTDYTESEDPSKEGSRVTINFKGTKDGAEIKEASADNVPIVLGDKGFVEDFEKALYGKKKDEKFSTDVSFPEDYQAKELAGQVLNFEIEVVKVEEGKSPELTEEFIKEKDEFPNTVEELKADLEERIKEYIESVNTDNKRYVVTDKYVKDNDFEMPKSFIEAELNVRESEYKKKNNVTEIPEEAHKTIRENAQWVAKRFIILSQLAKDLQVSVSDEELDKELEKDAAQYNIPVEYLKKVIDENRLSEKRIQIQEKKVLDKLMEKVTFKEKEQTEEEKNEK